MLFAASLSLFGCGSFYDVIRYAPSEITLAGKILPSTEGCYIGAFVSDSNIKDRSTQMILDVYEHYLARKVSVVMWFVPIRDSFPLQECNVVAARGDVPCITFSWENYMFSDSTINFSLQDIIDGKFDTNFEMWAIAAKEYKRPVFFRPFHEMNGNWYPWDGTHNGGAVDGPAKFIQAWKHIHNIFAKAGATNVTWVWNINAENIPDETWNSSNNYYPGDDYVDWIGIDGYNWGTTNGSSWKTFDQIFLSSYSDIVARYLTKPIMIGEMGCSDIGGDKSSWITDSFAAMKSKYPAIKAYNWFNINKETDWRIDSSSDAKAAIKSAMGDDYYLGDIK